MGLFFNRKNKKAKKENVAIQATEGDRNTQDPLQTPNFTTTRTIRKNNFLLCDDIIAEIKRKFVCYADYGVGLVGPLIEVRSALIGGEGLSITAKKKATQDFINTFLEDNYLKDGKFIELVEESEKEGKLLLIIKAVEEKKIKKIFIKHIPYNETKYIVEKDDFDRPASVSWQPDKGKKKIYYEKDFVYMYFINNSGDINNTPPKVGRVLTQIENYERALYDIRNNNHLYGFITPIVETENQSIAQWIINKINALGWKIGKAFALPGKVKYLTPDTGALEVLKGEMALNMMQIAFNAGIPIHLSNWVELMSNRATAETMDGMIELATKKYILKLKRGIKELIKKVMIKAVDNGVPGAINDPDGFSVELPQLTAKKLKEIMEVWFPLRESGHIAEHIFINKLPGVDPIENKKFLDAEEKEKEKKKPEEVKDFENKLDKMNHEDLGNKQDINKNEL